MEKLKSKLTITIMVILFLFSAINLYNIFPVHLGNILLNGAKSSQYFSDFGCFIGGILSPVLSALTILLMFFINKEDSKKTWEQMQNIERQYKTNIIVSYIQECKEKIDNILELKMNPEDYIDAFDEYKVYEGVMKNKKKISEYQSKTREEKIDYLGEREIDLETLLNTIYILDKDMLAEIVDKGKILNITHHLYNLKGYLNNLMILNTKYSKLTHNYLTTKMNLFNYHEAVNILVGAHLLNENDAIVDYFKILNSENLIITPSYDLRDYDEFYEGIYNNLLKYDNFSKKYENKMQKVISKMKVEIKNNNVIYVKIGFKKYQIVLNELFVN